LGNFEEELTNSEEEPEECDGKETKDYDKLWMCFKHREHPESVMGKYGISSEDWERYSAKFDRCRRLEKKLPRLYREMELHEKWWWNLQTHLMMKHLDEHPEDKEHPDKRQE